MRVTCDVYRASEVVELERALREKFGKTDILSECGWHNR